MCLDVLQKWMPSIEHKLAFACTCAGSSKKHFTFLKFHHRDCILRCELDYEYPLSPKHKFWLDPPKQMKVSLFMLYYSMPHYYFCDRHYATLMMDLSQKLK